MNRSVEEMVHCVNYLYWQSIFVVAIYTNFTVIAIYTNFTNLCATSMTCSRETFKRCSASHLKKTDNFQTITHKRGKHTLLSQSTITLYALQRLSTWKIASWKHCTPSAKFVHMHHDLQVPCTVSIMYSKLVWAWGCVLSTLLPDRDPPPPPPPPPPQDPWSSILSTEEAEIPVSSYIHVLSYR